MALAREQFQGTEDGPRLLILGGIHGDEFEPMAAIRELIRRLGQTPPARGRVTLVPVVNEPAFERGERVAEDGLDLARVCPGRKDGSITERIAAEISELIRSADFLIDLHTGGRLFQILPLVGYTLHPDSKVLEAQRRMARAFGLPIIWGTDSTPNGRTLSVARDAGIPAIYAEYLGGRGCDREGVARYVEGCLRVLIELGMGPDSPAFQAPKAAPPTEHFIEDARAGSGHLQVNHPANASGYFEPMVALGEMVAAGETLGRIVNPLGDKVTEVPARYAGLVLALRVFPRVSEGDGVAVILAVEKSAN